MLKSASFGVMHVAIAFAVGYALTGSVAIAGAITLIEPAVNTVAHHFFDRWWGHPSWVAAWGRWRGRAATAASARRDAGLSAWRPARAAARS